MSSSLRVALLTAGRDRPYAYGISKSLIALGLSVDIVGGDDLDISEWLGYPLVRYLNLKGDARADASLSQKIIRIFAYYRRLLWYATRSRKPIFHILWNNKFETFDRVPLMLYYRLLGKKTVLTVHNVNANTRDANDTWWNRQTLRAQYHLADHLFVHTNKMKQELVKEFSVSESAVSVIPFGINNSVPETEVGGDEARRRLGIAQEARVILFFGNIAPYKGLEYLIDAFQQVGAKDPFCRLVIAGNPKNCDAYWRVLQGMLQAHGFRDRIIQRIQYIPDEETEVYFKSADILVLPYRHIYQSGVLSLGYSFGLPVIASDVGALREDIVEGRTGYMCKPEDPTDLARTIERYFSSELFALLKQRRPDIRHYAYERYSWEVVGKQTVTVYDKLLGKGVAEEPSQGAPV